ncbi:choice-of-anchor A family protein [Stigmatella sp. ncwal1]|uniref:Choice-of-anchor A family protein n=1 Tax=Stigmatella ashevillensis TaxID=2995309 RepID=A0ABT5D9B4_9BACT|nr:choice-of-anchor A family protein [Stigmatella ashevillena]MDC0710265.1 choice-of-anchor A family protein [Stigmatella ashevillena]
MKKTDRSSAETWDVRRDGGKLAAVLMAVGGMACAVDSDQDALEQQQGSVSAERCEVRPPFNPSFEPELEWAWTGSPNVLPDHKQVMMTPVVVELNGDGVPDVVFNAYVDKGNVSIPWSTNGVVRAISGADGSDLWTVTNPAYRVRGASTLAAGDIDHDGKPELCTIPEDGNGFICFEHDGTFKFRTSIPANDWGGVSFADLDHDGNVEILDGNHVFSHTGVLKWVGADGMGGVPHATTGPISFAADIDGDGIQEVINDRAVYRADGTLKCRNTQIGHGLAGVGNFDADDRGEIVVVWSGQVSLLDDTCELLWTTPIPAGGEGGAPNIADFDNDGRAEIGVAGAYFYSVFETDGTVKWSSPTQDGSSRRTGSSTFDFEGDGRAEAVYADERHLRIYDGATGAVRFQVPHSSCTTYENPVIVDVDGDDNAEIVIAANVSCGFGSFAGIRVFRDKKDGWVNTRSIWNQHAYSVTNVNEDGTIPASPTANWLVPGLNTFRSNSQGSGTTSPFAAADLITENITSACDASTQTLTLSARVSNQGEAAASAGIQVAFFLGKPGAGGTLLGIDTLPNALLAGSSTLASLTLSPPHGGLGEIVVVVDYGPGNARELECREDNNTASAHVSFECTSCIEVRLRDYNLFVLGDYTLGTDVEGKVAAGGNITMNHFSVGQRLPDSDIAHTLVAGGHLTLSKGGVSGDAWHGGGYSADASVVYPRGIVAQGSPIDFAARGTALRDLSSRLSALTANGTTVLESWGGILLRGTEPEVNVFQVNAGAFTHAKLLLIDAPAGSLVVINVSGSSATFTGFGQSFSGGIDQHGVLFNFVDATAITAQGYGFWGTVLAPYAHIQFNTGSFDGAIYAQSMTGNAEGHLNVLYDRDICQ